MWTKHKKTWLTAAKSVKSMPEYSALDVTKYLNTLRPRQNDRRFPDDIFKCIILSENVWISIKISLKFFLKGPINNIPALV